ncbi:MAG: 5'-nucleotidase C-terminal domain-containing protein [Lachnospiraceae bacterium]|nr:5'-nucleotidase C-terminal domain-containing protein [Lachnospiraceae bacterium]
MKKILAKLCAIALVITMAFPGMAASAATKGVRVKTQDFSGKTIILHTNDVHGNVAGYTYIKGLKAYYEKQGAEVILVDCGDFSQGTPYVSISKGENAVTMMNAAAYDIAIPGNHEFDYGYEQLKSNIAKAKFKLLCADVFDESGKTIFDACTVWTTKSGVKIGFFGLETPETQTKVNPGLIPGIKFVQGEELYKTAQAEVDKLKAKSDIVICLAHLGVDAESAPNTSYDLLKNTEGIDLVLDGHSHTVMTEGAEGEAIQSTGTKFAYVGKVVIDDATKAIESRGLIPVNEFTPVSRKVNKVADKIIKEIDSKYGAVFAKTEVLLNGEKAPGNRTEETNLGDLITDAILWSVTKTDNALTVDADHIVAITNGGGIRATVNIGDITMKDINTVLPFGNTVAVVYVTGEQLLEALEASTYSTPGAVGGFPQVSGIKYTIDTTKEFDEGDLYPASTYHAPKSIKRVTIDEINGKAFSKKDTYAVITNDFITSGGDTYYVFSNSADMFDTGIVLDEAVVEYISTVLGGVIGSDYAEPQGRITIK